VHGPQGVLDEFATCIGCQNCMVVCPICYCKECIFRSACTMCERPIPSIVRGEDGPRKGGENGDSWGVDIAIGLLGVPNDRRLWVSVRSDELGASLGLEPAEEPAERTEAVQALIEARTVERDRRFAALTEQVHGPQGVLDEFATCIGCQNCMVVCPICYCKECASSGLTSSIILRRATGTGPSGKGA